MVNLLIRAIPLYCKLLVYNQFSSIRLKYQIFKFDRYRKNYEHMSFTSKKRLTSEWSEHYPEQAHFNFKHVDFWLKKYIPDAARILEIGGWRGDLAMRALAENDKIKYWHNYDLLELNDLQKCCDKRYQLITLDDYLWRISLEYDYNALIATHMIEHIKWRELKDLISWIPGQIGTVLFEAPLPASAENINWMGDHSSHILEKGWEQVSGEMQKKGFSVDYSADNTYIFIRKTGNYESLCHCSKL
jgi:hypothetical protein